MIRPHLQPQNFKRDPDVGDEEIAAQGITGAGNQDTVGFELPPAIENFSLFGARGFEVLRQLSHKALETGIEQILKGLEVALSQRGPGRAVPKTLCQALVPIFAGIVVSRGGKVDEFAEIAREVRKRAVFEVASRLAGA